MPSPKSDPAHWPAPRAPAAIPTDASQWFTEEVHPHEASLRAYLNY